MAGADLFAWREEADAAAAVAAAEEARALAERRAHYAPKGTKAQREAALRAATLASLQACIALSRAGRSEGA
ncbi:hypothetical protein [Phenylobacterium sp. 58.2.17]|uniref:hypothetical protein n=1 Tax=Phenylobacterium sp. 58.2.17 TaxID=2969306 RepID=UPI002264EB45|nr:hypothetical protein [Phenylobacterium sp. 58.2.17]MCX7586562.1 hypothetical protein [Phenylobacterium sp. 58.2.17]